MAINFHFGDQRSISSYVLDMVRQVAFEFQYMTAYQVLGILPILWHRIAIPVLRHTAFQLDKMKDAS
jgi:hypothetical protein